MLEAAEKRLAGGGPDAGPGAGPQGGPGAGGDAGGGKAAGGNDKVVDADFEEVDEPKKGRTGS